MLLSSKSFTTLARTSPFPPILSVVSLTFASHSCILWVKRDLPKFCPVLVSGYRYLGRSFLWDIPLRDGEGRHREPAQLDGFSQFAIRNIVIGDEVFVCCRLVIGGIFAFQLDKILLICYIRSR